jgi:hypothetical protein
VSTTEIEETEMPTCRDCGATITRGEFDVQLEVDIEENDMQCSDCITEMECSVCECALHLDEVKNNRALRPRTLVGWFCYRCEFLHGAYSTVPEEFHPHPHM